MALDNEDDYTRAIRGSYPSEVVDYYGSNSPRQVGRDARGATDAAIDVGSKVLNAATRLSTPLEAGGRAAVDQIGTRLGNFAGGVADFWRGFTGDETPAAAVAPRQAAPSSPSARVETPAQFADRVRNTGAEAPTRYIPGTTQARNPEGGTISRDAGMNGTLSTIGSQTDDWKRFLPGNQEPASAVQQVQVEERPSAIAAYMNSSRYRENAGRGRAGRNQIKTDLEGLGAVDAEGGRNARTAAELALRGREINQRGALEVGRWNRDAELQNQRLSADFARDDRRYQADERAADRRAANERDLVDYKYQLDTPERDARLGRQSLEQQQLGIQNADKQSALDLRTRAVGGDRSAMALIQALSSGSGKTGPTAELLDAFSQVNALRAAGKDAEARQMYDMFVKPYLKQGYAEGGEVAGAITPQVQTVHPLQDMYQQYAMNTQAVGAIPIQFGQFIDLVQGTQGNPGNMGMGYADGGFVDTMTKGFQRTWRNWTGGGEQPPASAPVQPQPQPAQGAIQPEQPQRFKSASERAIEEMDRRGYARGGAIDVSGHQVVGPGTGTSDSIPAVVDGQDQAALSHGEFVWTNSATENAGAGNLKHIMQGLERGDPTIVAGIIGLASKAAGSNAKAINTRGN
jgi:hypothetical protein